MIELTLGTFEIWTEYGQDAKTKTSHIFSHKKNLNRKEGNSRLQVSE